jgi:hypothetical protein
LNALTVSLACAGKRLPMVNIPDAPSWNALRHSVPTLAAHLVR